MNSNITLLLLLSIIILTKSRNIVYNLPLWSFNDTDNVPVKSSLPKYPSIQWKNISTSHSNEDIYAYSNYFYGISNGLVIETGIGQSSSSSLLLSSLSSLSP